MTTPTRLSPARLLALSLPTLAYAGYDLARRSYLAVYLSGELQLSVAAVGWLIMLASLASIPAELIAGAIGDHGLAGRGRRGQWMILGTTLIGVSSAALLIRERALAPVATGIALIALIAGWALCNVAHGAWALESTHGSANRARVFGWRSLFGIAGGVGFSAIAVWSAARGASPFASIMLPVAIGGFAAHALLIALVPDRRPVRNRWTPAMLVAPVRLLFANRPNRQLAALFALNGAHTAITATGYLYVAEFALDLPQWGAIGVFVQSVCAAAGVLAAIRLGARIPAPALLAVVLWANLLLALALLVIPVRNPAALIAWSALFGLFSMADFMALRTMLGERLDVDTATGSGDTRAAEHYAGFHLPFNLFGALASGALFLGYRWFGFDPGTAQRAEHTFTPVILIPALEAVALMAASLWIVAIFRRENADLRGQPPVHEAVPEISST